MNYRQIISIISSLLIFLILLFNITIASAQQNEYKSLLWKITGNDLEKPSYLYGTMHVSNKVAFHLSDTFFMAINACDIIALEISPETWLGDMMDSKKMNGILNYATRMGSMGNDFYTSFLNIESPGNQLIRTTIGMEYPLANHLLYRFDMMQEDFQENTFLDMFIFQTAKKLNKDVTSLEEFESVLEYQMKVLEEENDSQDDRIRINRNFDKIVETGNSYYQLLEDAYRKGDLNMLDSLNQMVSSISSHKYIIVERNKDMANKMDSILQYQTLFTGVGAAHLPGKKGVIELLRDKGYTLDPVVYIKSRKADKKKKKIENLRVDLSYNQEMSFDSILQIDIPGKLYQVKESAGIDQYFSPEHIHGGYYQITRIQTYLPTIDQNPEYLMSRIDSLLYEAIPGEIISSKRTKVNNFPCFDILNKTKRGDFQRYYLVVTPLELFIIKMNGTDDFVKTKEGDKFFNSINIIYPEINGKFTPIGGGFSINLKGIMIPDNDPDAFGPSTSGISYSAYDTETDDYYMIRKNHYSDYKYIEEDKFEMEYLAEKIAKQCKGKAINQKIKNKSGYPSSSFVIKTQSDSLFAEIHIVGPHYYFLLAKKHDCTYPKSFFDSFNIIPFKYDSKMEFYEDTSMFFTVNTPVEPSESNNRYDYFNFGFNSDDDQSYLGETILKSFEIPETSETIDVKFKEFAKYETKSIDESIKNKVRFWLRNDDDFVMIERDSSETETFKTWNFILGDTLSNTKIYKKLYYKGNAYWELSTSSSDNKNLSLFTSNFFESFTPADTTIGIDIEESKAELFLKNITNEDSLTRVSAIKSSDKVSFEDDHAIQLMETIDKFNANEINSGFTIDLLNSLGNLKNEKILSFLEKKYSFYNDTTDYQIAILRSIANQHTTKAIEVYTKLLTENPPFGDYISSIFYPLHDSLSLTTKCFPDILELIEYQEYKNDIYLLITNLNDSALAGPDLYISKKKKILHDARIELKRIKNSNTSNNYRYDEFVIEDVYNNNYSSENNILLYAKLLLPWKDETSVSSFYENFYKIDDIHTRLKFDLYKLENDKDISKIDWQEYSSDITIRNKFYQELEDMEQLQLFDTAFLSQEKFCESYILNSNFKTKEDSILFVTKRISTHKTGEGYMYFFKTKMKNDDNWKLNMVGPQPLNESMIESHPAMRERNINFEQFDLEEIIEENLEDVKLDERERAGGRRSNRYGDFFM